MEDVRTKNLLVKEEEVVMQGVEGAARAPKDEEAFAEIQEQKELLAKDPAKNAYLAKFTQLWFACYFERRLTRQKIEQADLVSIVQDLTQFFVSEGSKMNFRRALPLLQGLNVLFTRKMGYLLRDSQVVLKSMTEPSEVVKLEADQQANTKRKRMQDGAHPAPARNEAKATLQLNPNNFDWFLSGIDQSRLEAILGTGSKADNLIGGGMGGAFKTEDTFLMVREGEANDPLDDFSMPGGLGGQLLPDADALMEGSMYRNIPDEPAGFEHDLLRGELGMEAQPLFDAGDQAMQMNFLDHSRYDGITPIKALQHQQLVDFAGFGLDMEEVLDEHDFEGVAGEDKNVRADRRADKLRKEFQKLVLGHDRNIQIEKLSNKNRPDVKTQKDISKLKSANKDIKMLSLLTDPVSQLATSSTNRFVGPRIFANEKHLTSLNLQNVNANENGCLSFLDSFMNTNTADQSGLNLDKDQPSLFGDNAFVEAIIGEDGPSPFIGEEPLMGFDDPTGNVHDFKEHVDPKKLDEQIRQLCERFKSLMEGKSDAKIQDTISVEDSRSKRQQLTSNLMGALMLAQEGLVELEQDPIDVQQNDFTDLRLHMNVD